MDAIERSKEGQIQLLIEYGSQHGQLQVSVIEINGLILPAVKRLGISHVYVKSHLLNEKTKDSLKTKSAVRGFFIADVSKELKRKTEEVKLALACSDEIPGNMEEKNTENSRKSKIRKAFQKQRERFRLRRNSDKVKTVVNAAGDEDGRATLSFERPLFYPSVSLYQLQTQCLHLTICGRNVTTTRSFPIATACVPLMVGIKQYQPTWYPLSYNPDLVSGKEDLSSVAQETWEKGEGGAYTGRSMAWDKRDTKVSSQDNWIHKRKDYSRHLQPKQRRKARQAEAKKKTSKDSSTSDQIIQERPQRSMNDPGESKMRHGKRTGNNKNPRDDFNQSDSGVGLDRLETRHDSVEELHWKNSGGSSFPRDTGASNYFQPRQFRKPQKQWTSEFVICGPSIDSRRTSNGNNLDLSSLSLNGSLNRKPFGETIRGF